MTAEQSKAFRETQGLLHGCGYRLVSAGGDRYQIVQAGSGKVVGQGTLDVCRNAAVVLAGSDRKPETATGPEAYQRGLDMSRKLNQKK